MGPPFAVAAPISFCTGTAVWVIQYRICSFSIQTRSAAHRLSAPSVIQCCKSLSIIKMAKGAIWIDSPTRFSPASSLIQEGI